MSVVWFYMVFKPSVLALCGTAMWRLIKYYDILYDFVLQVRDYLIYRTAKDCSILVTIQPHQSLNDECFNNDNVFTIFVPTTDNAYRCNVSIVDLDPKPFSRMQEYLNKEWALQQAFLDSHSIPVQDIHED